MALRIANSINKITGMFTYTLFDDDEVVFTYPTLEEANSAIEHLMSTPRTNGIDEFLEILDRTMKEIYDSSKNPKRNIKCTK